ncbi:winged helix DNA-binding domain-containing protein [Gulosibacter chungangensis]|uniref:Winged helix DNA-binding domain-containing protein n=1 Tax=Gulosibacter chungangensis TaxID=979746 RepID=A0A7J5BCS0_9MICO|nr:winged helix DNA-binding domain-containing protein [Gulosibacter chungangensis]KAB1644007.1 winged helix DNA-binding domain-containing protein [Gulosibacter chungangensis]
MSEQAPLAFQDLVSHRLLSQGLVSPTASQTPLQAAERLACTQGQHLGGVIAALALRSGGNPTDVVAAFDSAHIVRAYPMRGTVFAVPAADVQWMSAIAGTRSVRAATRRRIELGLTDEYLGRIKEAILRLLAEAPEGALSRGELSDGLEQSGTLLNAAQRYHVLFTLIASGTLVYGPLRGREHLVVSAADWLPASGTLEARFNGDELAATAEWLRRYLVGHGPATLRDFAWWTKLPLGQVRKAMNTFLGGAELEHYGLNAAGEPLWGAGGLTPYVEQNHAAIAAARLLPPFDELLLGYQDRSAIVSDDHHRKIDTARNGVFKPVVYANGRIVATWGSEGSGKNRRLVVRPFEKPLSKAAMRTLERAFLNYPERR